MSNEHHDHGALYTGIKVERLPHSEANITGEVPVEAVATYRPKAIRRLGMNVELPGFRKGHVPEDMLVERLGEQRIMEEIAELVLAHAYAHIVEDEKLDVVGRPAVTITKLAPGNPIAFKITTALYPAVELPDYKKIASDECAKHGDPEQEAVADDEVHKELERLRDLYTKASAETEDRPAETEEVQAPKEPAPIDDEFARAIGQFKDLADLRGKMREQMLADKKRKAFEKRRLALADAVLAKTKIDTPNLFVEGELSQMVASFEDRVRRAGLTMENYLANAKKTIDDLRTEWRPDAEKRAKLQLTLTEIAKKEAIAPDTERLEREVEHIMEHYTDADRASVRTYVASQMLNDKVFELLEGKSGK